MKGRASLGDVVGGRYRLDELIGEGSSGVVFGAQQLDVERAVAIKFLRRQDDATARARFAREARVASQLGHPNAIAIYELGDYEGRPFIAMERAFGTSLRALVGQLTPDRAVAIVRSIAEVALAAHDVGLVHRDLKPENVILEGDDRVRVLDFGLAFVDAHARDDRMTAHGVVSGTAAYCSPEQARGGDVGPATDVYALGCILMELLTGAPPFAGSELEVLTRQLYAAPPAVRSTDGAPLPASAEALIHAMLDKRPGARPSAREVIERLAHLDETRRARDRDGTRTSRMVRASRADAGDVAREGLEVAIVGQVDPSLLLGLAALDFVPYVVTDDEPMGAPAVILAVGEQDIGALISLAPVVAEADPSDLARIEALVDAGAVEVVPRPLRVDAVASRLRRAVRKRARR